MIGTDRPQLRLAAAQPAAAAPVGPRRDDGGRTDDGARTTPPPGARSSWLDGAAPAPRGSLRGRPRGNFGASAARRLRIRATHAQHDLGQLLEDVELAHLMGHAGEDLGQRHRVQGRAVGGDPVQRCRRGRRSLAGVGGGSGGCRRGRGRDRALRRAAGAAWGRPRHRAHRRGRRTSRRGPGSRRSRPGPSPGRWSQPARLPFFPAASTQFWIVA